MPFDQKIFEKIGRARDNVCYRNVVAFDEYI